MDILSYYSTVERLCMLNGKMEAIIESSTNAIFEIDSDGCIVYANPAFLELFHSRVADNPHFLSFFDNMELSAEINEVFSGNREFTMKEAHLNLTLPSGEIDRKFIEGKIFKVTMPGSTSDTSHS